MVYCSKCGKKNDDDAEFCIKCGSSLIITQTKSTLFEKKVEDFAEEVEQLTKKVGKTIEQVIKNFDDEVKDIRKRDEKVVKDDSNISDDSFSKTESREYKKLYRSGKNKILGGVCGGVAEYFKMDPILIRIIWVIIILFPPGLGILLYILFWIFVPRNPNPSWN